jgi:hypothetical protein
VEEEGRCCQYKKRNKKKKLPEREVSDLNIKSDKRIDSRFGDGTEIQVKGRKPWALLYKAEIEEKLLKQEVCRVRDPASRSQPLQGILAGNQHNLPSQIHIRIPLYPHIIPAFNNYFPYIFIYLLRKLFRYIYNIK